MYKYLVFLCRMQCQICFKGGKVYRMSCGHTYHIDCLRRQNSDWSIPCCACRHSLAKAVHDGKQWYIGVDTENALGCFFKVTDESKIVPYHECVSLWQRANGRLLRRQLLPLKCNICVS